MERETEERLVNAIRDTKARQKRFSVRPIAVPSVAEIPVNVDSFDDLLRRETLVLPGRELRVGVFPWLSINGDRYTMHGKGKEIPASISEDLRRSLASSSLSLHSPFTGLSERVLDDQFRYQVRRLRADDGVEHKYGAHSQRHFHALKLYQKALDISLVYTTLNPRVDRSGCLRTRPKETGECPSRIPYR